MSGLTARQAELLTPNERRRIERLEAAKPTIVKYRSYTCGKIDRIISKLESRAEYRELARMIEADTPALAFTRPLPKKAEPFKRYAKRPFCG